MRLKKAMKSTLGKKVLVTGAAGFIGFHTVNRLLKEGYEVVALDNINDYYDVGLKYDRLKEIGLFKDEIKWSVPIKSELYSKLIFYRQNIEDSSAINDLFSSEKFDFVIHLAAQAGVRYSLVNPHAYINSNINGFMNILEACRHYPVKHLLYASSSSVYGSNTEMPFKETDNVDRPTSLYAATKRANELMAHSYSHLFNIPTTGLRFFTVYGPWGRPDMALFIFTKAILDGIPIEIFNNGDLIRDYTYIDDIIEGLYRVMTKPVLNLDSETNNFNSSDLLIPYRILNIGNSKPEKLLDFVREIENRTGKQAIKILIEMQAGDVLGTWANIDRLYELTAYKPITSIPEGIDRFVRWYISYYKKTYQRI
jgi:UDP-glucuronate 4-epimerase